MGELVTPLAKLLDDDAEELPSEEDLELLVSVMVDI